MKAGTLSILAATLCLQLSLTAADESATTSAPASPSSTQWWQDDSNPAGAATQPRYGDTPSNVTGRVGHSAFLPCTVQHLGDRSVTWMRQRDLHILTAGIFTYSADERFRVLHPENSNDWTLEIRFATLRDSGVYECHVNSDPKISRQVNLVVTDKQLDDPAIFGAATATTEPAPVVMIEGLTERHIQAGSVLSITCLVLHPLQQAPAHVLWFHGTENIDYDSPRGGVSIQTEKFPRKTRSQVMINNVRDTDSGEYSCSPSDLPPSVITVHVQHGQHHAAVQQGGLSGAPVTNPVTHFLLLLLILMFSRAR